MAVKQDPRTGIWYDWTLGDNNYDVNLNANLKKLGLLYALSAKSRTVSTPPGSPTNGDVYIVGPSATGVWAGHEDDVTIWISAETAWVFYTPRTGYLCDIEDEGLLCKYNGSAWVAVGNSGIGTGVDNAIARYNGTNAVQSSGITLADDDSLSGVTGLTVDNINVDGNTISTSTGSLQLSPAGSVDVAQATAGVRGMTIQMPTGAETTASALRLTGYSPSLEFLDKDGAQNWYFGIDDGDGNKLSIGRGYGPGQGIPAEFTFDPATLNIGIGNPSPATKLDVGGAITMTELSADPANPSEGKMVIWMSDGTGTGDDGDVLVKITVGGVTKTTTLIDFSAI